jgi:hypothetical protein
MNYFAILLLLLAGCSLDSDAASPPITVKVTAPASVTGSWVLVDTSHVLRCAYDLAASVTGGRDDDSVEWTGATIVLRSTGRLPATQPYSAASVRDWFHAGPVPTGSGVTAHMTLGPRGSVHSSA